MAADRRILLAVVVAALVFLMCSARADGDGDELLPTPVVAGDVRGEEQSSSPAGIRDGDDVVVLYASAPGDVGGGAGNSGRTGQYPADPGHGDDVVVTVGAGDVRGEAGADPRDGDDAAVLYTAGGVDVRGEPAEFRGTETLYPADPGDGDDVVVTVGAGEAHGEAGDVALAGVAAWAGGNAQEVGGSMLVPEAPTGQDPEMFGDVVYRIAFGSCLNQSSSQPMWDAVNTFHPNLFILLGDNIYADDELPYRLFGPKATFGPFRKIHKFVANSQEEIEA